MKKLPTTTLQAAFFRHVLGCPCLCSACLGLVVVPVRSTERPLGFQRAVGA